MQASKSLALEDLPVVGAEIAWALAQIFADAGRTTDAVATAEAGYTVATRSLDAPHMRFNIADAEVSALLLAGRITDAREVAERIRRAGRQSPRGGPVTRCGRGRTGRAWCRRSGHRTHAAGSSRQTGCPCRIRSAGDTATGSHTRLHSRVRRLPTDEAAAVLATLDKVQRSIPVAGLRAEPGPRVGGCGTGWDQ